MSAMPAVAGLDAIFHASDDGRYEPTALAVGPWDPDALHGGPPCALLAGALEREVGAADLGADFGNGVSKLFDMDRVLFVNPDLTVSLYRLPVGEWVCLDASTLLGDDGVGLAESVLFDVAGPIGRSTQTLLVEPR